MLLSSLSEVSDSSELSSIVSVEMGCTFVGGCDNNPLVVPVPVLDDDIVSAAAVLSASVRT
jgi:hypothetical protein